MIKIGDWVTQYSAGYWKVVNIIPQYADEDYCYNGISWKKGDRIGDWVIMKKGLTSKMKPSNGCDFADIQWCKPVSEDTRKAIEAAFAENPKAKQKFEKAPDSPKPAINSCWMMLTDEQAVQFFAMFSQLPERFTFEQFWSLAEDYKGFLADPSKATHILYLLSYPWELSKTFDLLYFGPECKKINRYSCP